MIALQLSRTVSEIRGPRDQEWKIAGDIRGLAISRESLRDLLTPDELKRLPDRSVFSIAMDGADLRAACDPEIPLTVDGNTPLLPMHHRVLQDRGMLTLHGLTFTYTVKYV